jgi:hypothetical protein
MKLNVKELEMLIRKETAMMNSKRIKNTEFFAPVWDIRENKYFLCNTSTGKKCEHIKDGFDSYSDAVEALIQMRKEVRWEDTELKSEELF